MRSRGKRIRDMADFADRAAWEQRIARALGRLGQEQFQALQKALGDPPDINNLPPGYWGDQAKEMQGILQPLIEAIFRAAAVQIVNDLGIGMEWADFNAAAARWARDYSFNLVRGITDKTQAALQEQIAGFFEDKRTLGDLYKSIGELFGPVRAEMIAVTETTRAAVQGELAFADELQKLGLNTTQRWQTSNDDHVCPICGPLDQALRGNGWTDPPPAHPRCRCWVNTEVVKV